MGWTIYNLNCLKNPIYRNMAIKEMNDNFNKHKDKRIKQLTKRMNTYNLKYRLHKRFK